MNARFLVLGSMDTLTVAVTQKKNTEISPLKDCLHAGMYHSERSGVFFNLSFSCLCFGIRPASIHLLVHVHIDTCESLLVKSLAPPTYSTKASTA